MSRRIVNHNLVPAFRTLAVTRFVALVLIVAAGSAPSIASWHEAAVQHVRCSEHGELVHGASMHRHGNVDVARGASLLSEENSGSPESDDHCQVALMVPGNAPSPIRLTSVRFTPPVVPDVLVESRSAPPGRAFVLASAPKTSPPTV